MAIGEAGQGVRATAGEASPLAFSFDEKTFKVGDSVSYRVNGTLESRPQVDESEV